MPRRHQNMTSPSRIQHTHIRMLWSLLPRVDHVANHSADAAAMLEATWIDVENKARQFADLLGL